MLTPFDMLEMKRESQRAAISYRETVAFVPTVTSGSNYENFTASAYDISGPTTGQYVTSFVSYRLYARVKIVRDTTLNGINQVVPGIETGDYLMYFRDIDRDVLDDVVSNENAYLMVDGITLRPYNTTLNGVAQTFDVFVHAKKYSPKYRPSPDAWVVGASQIGWATVT